MGKTLRHANLLPPCEHQICQDCLHMCTTLVNAVYRKTQTLVSASIQGFKFLVVWTCTCNALAMVLLDGLEVRDFSLNEQLPGSILSSSACAECPPHEL
eukprot:4632333-Amphidinium_carterae.1